MKRHIRLLGLATVLALAVAAELIIIPGGAQKLGKPQSPPPNPAIVFTAEKICAHTNLIVMEADGANQKVIVNVISGGGVGNKLPPFRAASRSLTGT